jgi:transposase-like protein
MNEALIENRVVCPVCKSFAVYKNGHARGGIQRYLCLLCNRQFLPGHERVFPETRPACPRCSEEMYLFKKKEAYDVFRCAHYPVCRTYVKVGRALSGLPRDESEPVDEA